MFRAEGFRVLGSEFRVLAMNVGRLSPMVPEEVRPKSTTKPKKSNPQGSTDAKTLRPLAFLPLRFVTSGLDP